MTGVEVLVAVSIAVGVVGVVVPLLPGALLVWLAIVVWGITVGTATGWAVVGVATAVSSLTSLPEVHAAIASTPLTRRRRPIVRCIGAL